MDNTKVTFEKIESTKVLILNPNNETSIMCVIDVKQNLVFANLSIGNNSQLPMFEREIKSIRKSEDILSDYNKRMLLKIADRVETLLKPKNETRYA